MNLYILIEKELKLMNIFFEINEKEMKNKNINYGLIKFFWDLFKKEKEEFYVNIIE